MAFDPERDCQVCRAQAMRKLVATYRIPKRSHHSLCPKNTKTKGNGQLSAHTLACQAEAKRLEAHFSAPLNNHEKGSSVHLTKKAGQAFFAPKKPTTKTLEERVPERNSQSFLVPAPTVVSAESLCTAQSVPVTAPRHCQMKQQPTNNE